MQLTKNFDSKEFECTCCGKINMSPIFMAKLQLLRDEYKNPMKINSGFRCKDHNDAVGGSSNSKHLSGIAADIACTTSSDRYKLMKIAFALGFKGIGVYKTFIHLDTRHSHQVVWIG